MKRFIILLALIGALCQLNAQQYYHFASKSPQGFSIESSTKGGLSLHYGIAELGIAGINNGEVKGQEIILKGSFAPNAEGYPNLPVTNRYIALPKGASFSLQVKENASTLLKDIDLLPAAPVQSDLAVGLPELRKEESVFSKDANYPSENVVLSAPFQIRSVDVVILSVTPFRYNPVRRELEVIHDMDIEIRFEGGSGQFGDSRYMSPSWEQLLRNLLINGEMIPQSQYYQHLNENLGRDDAGCEYLIIAPDIDSILALADTLKKYRTQQGIPTKVVTVSECGGNEPELIRNYIINAYNNWAIPPSAVSIFSGYGLLDFGIKPFTHSMDYDGGNWQNHYTYSTDYPYCDIDGDSLPDLAISRFAARNLDEYRILINKTIQYETDPPLDDLYYDHPIITAGHEDNKWFLITSQCVNGFYRNKLGKHPTNNYMVYDQTGMAEPPDSLWSTGYNTNVVVDYFGPNGQNYITATPGTLHDWLDWTDINPLVEAFDKGSFMTLYRDHSSTELWASPWFYTSDIPKIKCDKPTFILSIGCHGTQYDEFWGYSYNQCMVDAFNFRESGGAVGGIGATSATQSHYNDILTWGMYDCIWPEFLPDMGSDVEPEFVRPAFFLAGGKFYLRDYTFLPNWWSFKADNTLNLFSFSGETYLNLYTLKPSPIQITADAFHPKNQTKYAVDAENGTIVCVSKGDEIIGVARSDGQTLTFSLPQMEISETFHVTATKHNRIRFDQDVTIVPESGPYVIMEKLSIENDDNILHYNETVNLGISLHNYGNNDAEHIEADLLCDSPYIEIIQGTTQYQGLNSLQQVDIIDAFRIKIDKTIPDQTEVCFTIHMNDGLNDFETVYKKKVVAPILTVSPDFTIMNNEQHPLVHIQKEGFTEIQYKVRNTGHCKSGPVSVKYEVFAPFIDIENSHFILDDIQPDSLLNLSFRVNAHANKVEGAWVKTRLTINDIILDTIIPYNGIYECFETDSLNALFTWENYASHPWYFSEEDAIEGQRCLASPANHTSQFVAHFTDYVIPRESYVSFYYKISQGNRLLVKDGNQTTEFTGTEWTFAKMRTTPDCESIIWLYFKRMNDSEFGAKIDNICFPPPITAIAYSGGRLVSCKASPVVINNSYAYDYQTLYWTTDGDGHFDDNSIVHPTYFPGPQDLASGNATLTLHADEAVSPLQLVLTDQIVLGGLINGDSHIHLSETQISHYSVEEQDGLHYIWQLEPADVGTIFANGNAADIVWNPNSESDEAVLSVSVDNGCEVTPLSLSILLTGYSITEQSAPSFDIYPNPTDGKVNIILNQNVQGKALVEVYNILGNRILTKTIANITKGETISFDLHRFAKGLYIIKLSSSEGNLSKKIDLK